MKDEPLFIKFLNGEINYKYIIDSVVTNCRDEKSKQYAINKLNDSIDLSFFRNDFRNVVIDLIDNGINQRVINYLNSYLKPSLEEFSEDVGGSRVNESRYIAIKSEDAPWLEAIVCYNLCIFIKAYNFQSIKECATCHKFFSYKGKYAKYCSEACKSSGA